MTKPRTEFSEENRLMARRALWLLRGGEPAQDVPALDLDALMGFPGQDGRLVPLAHFAYQRHLDAQRDDPPPTASARVDMLAQACRRERQADELVRQVTTLLQKAAEAWGTAADLRAEAAKPEFSDGIDQESRVLAGGFERLLRMAQVLALLVERYRRDLTPALSNWFPSLCGLPQAQRNLELDAQALRLHESGLGPEEIAFVVNWAWSPGEAELIPDRVRQRLAAALQREKGACGEAPSEE
ncbi:MAG: hypothetical protein QM756_12680 [Polyangiaceae bacterium]